MDRVNFLNETIEKVLRCEFLAFSEFVIEGIILVYLQFDFGFVILLIILATDILKHRVSKTFGCSPTEIRVETQNVNKDLFETVEDFVTLN